MQFTCIQYSQEDPKVDNLSTVINHPWIFEWFYWLLYVTWCKSPESYHAIDPARVDICPPILSVEEKDSKRKNFNFSFLLFNMKGIQTRVTEYSDSDSKKLMASAVPESTKLSSKYAVNVFEGEESHE